MSTAVSAEPAGATTASGGRRWASWVVIGAPVLLLAQRAWDWRWMSDDGFIHLRVVRQLVSGNGMGFNAGERVEASTSPLWVLLLGAADLLTPVRLEWLAVLGGIALTLAGVVLAALASRRLVGAAGRDEMVFPVGLAVVVAIPAMWTYASSGLEGGLVTAWLGAAIYAMARWCSGDAGLPAATALFLGLGPLIRPDLAIFAGILLVVAVIATWHTSTWTDRLRVVALVAAIPLVYQVFRMGYYGVLVPNTAIAKEASRSWWSSGWDYLRLTADPYWLWIPAVVLALGAYLPLVRTLRHDGRRRELLVASAFAVGGVVHLGYVLRVGGDFMPSRLLLPGIFAICAPVAVLPVRRRFAAAALVLPWAVVCFVWLREYSDTHQLFRRHVEVEDFDEFGGRLIGRGWFDGEGLYYRSTELPAEPSGGMEAAVAEYGIGLPSYALGPDVYVIDMLGLADPVTAHFELERRGLIPGHEKPQPLPWMVARFADPSADLDEEDIPEIEQNIGIVALDQSPQGTFADRVTAARLALRCRRLEELQASYTEDLTPGRIVENLVESVSNTRLRYPAEPAEAQAELCG